MIAVAVHRLHHLFHPLRLLLALYVLISAAVIGVLMWRYFVNRRHRPKIAKADIVYRENFASGASQKNALTQMGGARNCLRLAITKEMLWIGPWFPFSLLSPFYDLEHVIPIARILSVRDIPSRSHQGLLLTYANESGENRALKLYPQDRDAFLRALSIPVEQPIPSTATKLPDHSR